MEELVFFSSGTGNTNMNMNMNVDDHATVIIPDLPSYVSYVCQVLDNLFLTEAFCSHAMNLKRLFRLCGMIYTYFGNLTREPTCTTSAVDPKDPLSILQAEKAVWTSIYRHFYANQPVPECADDSIDGHLACNVNLIRVLMPYVKGVVEKLRMGDSPVPVIPSFDWSAPASSALYPRYDLSYADQTLEKPVLDPLRLLFSHLVPVVTQTSTKKIANIYKAKLGTRPVYIKSFLTIHKRLLHEKEVYRRIRWYMHHSPQRELVRTHFIEPFMFLSYPVVVQGGEKKDVMCMVTEDTGASSLYAVMERSTHLEITSLLLQLCIIVQLMQSMHIVHNDFTTENVIAVPTEPFHPVFMDTESGVAYRSEVPCSYVAKVYDFDQSTMKDGTNESLDRYLCNKAGICNDLTSQRDAFLVWFELFFAVKDDKRDFERYEDELIAMDSAGYEELMHLLTKNLGTDEDSGWNTFCVVRDGAYQCPKLIRSDILTPSSLAKQIVNHQRHVLATTKE